MITRVSTTAVYVSDQGKAFSFWTEQVGFVKRAEVPLGPAGSWLEVSPADAQTCVVLLPRAFSEDWQERKTSIVFHCASVQETYDQLSARGVEFPQPPTPMPWGNYATFVDPDGNAFGLTDAK